ncbi:unnamed protein product [Rotaria magnacalcarata]|uniref:Uncharacterized protein n=1 Tax=Rotaria magnacalcarata TaxID=392030 RepID=A0A8S2S5M3_9BILA|nr:unnamed protein product [Rotaria magnacalcarata]CAF4274558.1 unnamed protein product [Rotaria magnacalcarata]
MWVLYPSDCNHTLCIWSDLYLRDTRYTPVGSSEHPPSSLSLVPARLCSHEYSSSLLADGLHRSTADPWVSGSLRLESSSTTY